MPTILCIGKNYAAHVKEMGEAVDPTQAPVVFLKPWHAQVHAPDPIRLPRGCGAIHHEAEVVVRVGTGREPEAIALGLDLTDRTLQSEAKKKGHPWAAAKGFLGSAPIGPFVPVSAAPPLDALRFTLAVNGVIRQHGDTSRMLRSIPALLAALDAWFGLSPGDLVFTGTPEGVASIEPGDELVLDAPELPTLSCRFRVEASPDA